VQLLGIGAALCWAFPVAYVVYKVIAKTIGLRASTMDEQRGLDYSEHYETAYPEFDSTVIHQPVKAA
jgi:Amt family ammonium transporter